MSILQQKRGVTGRGWWVMAAGLGLVLGAGCATGGKREVRDPVLWESYSEEVRAQIERGEVLPGYTPEQVRMAVGRPSRVSTRRDANGESEVWIYESNDPRVNFGFGLGTGGGGTRVGTGVGVNTGGRRVENLRVTLRDGVVTAVERMR